MEGQSANDILDRIIKGEEIDENEEIEMTDVLSLIFCMLEMKRSKNNAN